MRVRKKKAVVGERGRGGVFIVREEVGREEAGSRIACWRDRDSYAKKLPSKAGYGTHTAVPYTILTNTLLMIRDYFDKL